MGGTTRGGNERGAVRSAELIEATAELLLTRGLVDLSLRTMATQLNTSHRMLLYYFQSRERLVATALETLLGRLGALLDEVEAAPSGSIDATAEPVAFGSDAHDFAHTRRLFEFMNGSQCRPYRRLLLEAWPLASGEPDVYGHFVDPRRLWLPAIERALRADQVPVESLELTATVLLATLNGLFISGQVAGDEWDDEQAMSMIWAVLRSTPRAA